MAAALPRSAFVELVKLARLGDKLAKPVEEEIARRGVIDAINEVELMGGHYAGYADMMAAPAVHVARTRLVLAGKTQAEQEQSERIEAETKRTGSGSGGTGGVGGTSPQRADTHVSAYYPHTARDEL